MIKNAQELEKFKKWLEQNGAEILAPTNEYEMLRFKGKYVGVIYSSGSVNGGYASDAIRAFKRGKKWNGKPISTGRNKTYKKQKLSILERDGDNCFYCGKKLGEDITLEHLLALTKGGKNNLHNMVLAHEQCNQDASHLDMNKKVELAVRLRLNNSHKS